MIIFCFLGVGPPCCSILCQFWLCEEAQCVYLRRHLGSPDDSCLNELQVHVQPGSTGLCSMSSLRDPGCSFTGQLLKHRQSGRGKRHTDSCELALDASIYASLVFTFHWLKQVVRPRPILPGVSFRRDSKYFEQ